jgi:ribosomal protein S18 acetylase RimI-like enzyme
VLVLVALFVVRLFVGACPEFRNERVQAARRLVVAVGLGVLERGYVGLYDIYVDASCRRRGFGGDICTAIMQYGKARGCHTAYLQCLTDNLGARALYDLLGYQETYHYWFRTKSLTD